MLMRPHGIYPFLPLYPLILLLSFFFLKLWNKKLFMIEICLFNISTLIFSPVSISLHHCPHPNFANQQSVCFYERIFFLKDR